MYASSDCFETFPLPRDWEENAALDAAGKMYYEHRTKLVIDNDEGMTKTYNRFHDIYETDPRIVVLRELHATMDRAVLDVYGWTDIRTDCDFIRDYEIVEAAWGRKKKSYRYRLPDPVRDEVLAYLLALNGDRAAGENRAGSALRALKQRPEPAPLPRPERRPATMVAEPAARDATSDD